MTWGFAAQRRADEFDTLVEGASTDSARLGRDEALLTLVTAMRSVPEVQARPEFVSDLRAQLMAEAATVLVPDDLSRLRLPQRHTRRERRIAALVGGIAIVGATTSVAVASQSALPGESLYPVKRVLESARTTVSLDEGAKGSAMLGSARSRLDEARQLSQQSDQDGRVAESLSTFTDQATAAADLLLADYADHGHASSIQALRTFAATSLADLESLEPMIPYDARDELLAAAAALTRIDADAATRCSACDSAPLADLPISLTGEEPLPPVLPAPTASPVVDRTKPGRHRHHQSGTALPQVGGGTIGPGSVSTPGSDPTDPTQTTSPATDPLGDIIDSVTGGGGKSTSTKPPRVPVVGDLTEGVGALLGGVLDSTTGLVGGLTGQSGDTQQR